MTTTPSIHTSRGTVILTLLIIAAAIWCLAYPPLPMLTLMADSAQYERMSEAIFTGEFFRAPRGTLSTEDLAISMRPPLYPLVLGFAQRIPWLDDYHGLVAIHLLIGLAILVITPWMLRASLAMPLSATATAIALLSAKQVAWANMSEWLAMSLIFLASISYIAWRHAPSRGRALIVVLLLSLAVLTRSALLPWLLLGIVIFFQAPKIQRLGTFQAILLGLTPLFLCALLNMSRFGTFTLGRYERLNLLASARTLGPVPINSDDPIETQTLLSILNERGSSPQKESLAPELVHQWDGDYYLAYHKNFDLSVEAAVALGKSRLPSPISILARSVVANFNTYLRFIAGSFYTFTSLYAPLILACVALNCWLLIRARGRSDLVTASIAITLVSLIYLASIFTHMLWLHRYIIPIQPVLLFCSIIGAALLLGTFAGHRDR